MSNTGTPLSATPEPVAHADALIAGLDSCLVAGFARLGSAQREHLASLGRIFAGTPLSTPVTAAVEALQKSQITEEHLVAMACARESLQGARHDALRAQAEDALAGAVVSRTDIAHEERELSGPANTYMSSTRQWLVELALAGLAQLEAPTVVPFADTLEAMQALPELFGLSALLTGFLDELSDHLPTASVAEIPARRWADLWSQCMVGAWRARPVPQASAVSGTLKILGADVRHHDHAVSVVAYGLLERKGEDAAVVRTTVSTWKVDAVVGDEVWLAFADVPGGRELLGAIAERKTLTVKNAHLRQSGDLVLDGSVKLGKGFDSMATALSALAPGAQLAVPGLPPLQRHPAFLAVPVALDGVDLGGGKDAPTIAVGETQVRLATERVSPLAAMELSSLKKCRQLFGLLRYDGGGWALQPLRGQHAKGVVGPGASMTRGLKAKKSSSTLGTLQERASKLLRGK